MYRFKEAKSKTGLLSKSYKHIHLFISSDNCSGAPSYPAAFPPLFWSSSFYHLWDNRASPQILVFCNDVTDVTNVIDGILIQRSIALFFMSAQAELTVGAVATQTTCMFWRNGVNCFLVHSFLVSHQIGFCCRIIAACTLSSFEVTRKTLVFSMCVAHVVC